MFVVQVLIVFKKLFDFKNYFFDLMIGIFLFFMGSRLVLERHLHF
jgi:hypothetical protein